MAGTRLILGMLAMSMAAGVGYVLGKQAEKDARFAAGGPETAPQIRDRDYGWVRPAGPSDDDQSWDAVDEAADESFPASDPAAFNPGTAKS